jgi:predicted PurR-regulated permease PerM
LLVGTKIAGFLGLIVAVPVASSIKGLFEISKIPPSQPAEIADNPEITLPDASPSEGSTLASA